jgi:hypothetical protein
MYIRPVGMMTLVESAELIHQSMDTIEWDL